MIGAQELISSVYGAFRLALGREDGMAHFNATPAGFWRSFFAAVLVTPGYLILNLADPEAAAPSANPIHDGLIYVLAYVISWVAFPLAMVPVSSLVEREERFIPFIVANNWAAVPQICLLVAVTVLRAGLGLNEILSGLIGLATFGAILTYLWFVARTALKVPGFGAVGVVALNVALTVVISGVAKAFTAAAPVQ